MSDGQSVRYDGSFAGWCAVCMRLLETESPEPLFWDYGSAVGPEYLFGEVDLSGGEAEAETWNRFLTRLESAGGAGLIGDLLCLFLSEAPDREMLMFRMVRISLERKRRGRGWHTHPDMRRAGMLINSMRREAHRLRGLLRFAELRDGTLYARCAPKHNVIPLVTGHFRRRMPKERWIIHDELRAYGLAWDGFILRYVDQFPSDTQELLSASEQRYRSCWQTFFREVTVPERHNPRLQRHFLPERFRRYLPELEPDRFD